MSSLIETYATACGVKIDKPFLLDTFYPLETPLDHVILVHAFAGAIVEQNGQKMAVFPAKIYSHFAEVIALLAPIVEPLGYRFYQIGAPNEPPLKGAQCLCGRTTLHQAAYLVKNAALLIGNDSQWAHVRGAEGKSLVELFGATAPGPHGPYWKNPEKTILIESHRGGRKPSFSSQESPKTVDFIPPESAANAALRLLAIPDVISRKTAYIGPDYPNVEFSIVPNMVVPPQMQIGVPILRMDLEFNEQVMAANLQARKCVVATDKEINPNILAQLKPNIALLRICVDALTPQWVKTVKRLGIPVQALSRETNENALREMRLKLFEVDCFFDVVKEPTADDLRKEIAIYRNSELDTTLNIATLSFRTNRFLFSSGKIHLSIPHWRAGRSVESIERNVDTVIDDVGFWSQFREHYLFTP